MYFMKKILLILLMLIVSGIGITGCLREPSPSDKAGEDNLGYQVFEAEVIETGERLLVAPDKESTEYTSSDRIAAAISEAQILDEQKHETDMDRILPGDRIRISYDGLIAESYPAQITADMIEIVGHNKLIDGFLALIDDVYQEDSGLNHDITMIAFDTTGWAVLSGTETETILVSVKAEYGLEIVIGTFDELAEQGLIDKENLIFEKGILIEIKEIEISKDRNKISGSVKKWRSGKGAIGWVSEAELKEDGWNITRDQEWIS